MSLPLRDSQSSNSSQSLVSIGSSMVFSLRALRLGERGGRGKDAILGGVNAFHRWYCKSDGWAKRVRKDMMPWVLKSVDLSGDVLEIGPGPGVTTDCLREHAAKLTCIEIDPRLASSLKERLVGTNVAVHEGDATAMPFANASFDLVLSFTMLHHIPSAELQDRLVGEAYRVLRRGGVFYGSDSTPSLMWNVYHIFDTRTPVDPAAFPARLGSAGFKEPQVNVFPGGFSFRATKP
jgi:SAM-dependent methyltransferase